MIFIIGVLQLFNRCFHGSYDIEESSETGLLSSGNDQDGKLNIRTTAGGLQFDVLRFSE